MTTESSSRAGGVPSATVDVRDNDCHVYRIPAALEPRFQVQMEAINRAKFGSSAWHDANDALDHEFGKYMFGG